MFFTDDIVFVHVPLSGGKSVTKSFGHVEGGKIFKGSNLAAHATAREIREVMGEREFSQRWSFSVIRNPWKRMVSMYYCYCMLGKIQKHFGDDWEAVFKSTQTFRDFFFNYPNSNLPGTTGTMRSPQMYWANGVDEVFNMEEEHVLNIEMAKRGYRKGIYFDHLNSYNPHNPYQSYYNEEMKSLVEDWFREDIEMFHYVF